MLSFQEYLTEGRDAPLFHGIKTFDNAYRIIYIDKVLMPKTHQDNWKLLKQTKKEWSAETEYSQRFTKGISLTRDLQYARVRTQSMDPRYAIILTLNQRKLAQKYKIVPIQYWQSFFEPQPARTNTTWNEAEEFLITDNPLPITPYLQKIFIGSKVLSACKMSREESIHDLGEKLLNDNRVHEIPGDYI